jgi:PTS system nitrogen regulatory IIA component
MLCRFFNNPCIVAAMFLNIIELAQSLGVDESEVEGWIRRDGLPHIIERGRLLFDRVQVVDWAASRGMAAKVGFLAPTHSKLSGGMRLEPLLRIGGIHRNVSASGILDFFAEIVAKLPGATPPVRQLLQQRLRAPNGISWAAVGNGLALPHLRTAVALGRDAGAVVLILLRDTLALPEPAPDAQPITRLLFFIAPSPRAHLEMLAQLSTALTHGNLHHLISSGSPDEDIFVAVASAEHPKETNS